MESLWQQEDTCGKEKQHKNFKQMCAVQRVLVRGSMFHRLPHESLIVVHGNCSTVYSKMYVYNCFSPLANVSTIVLVKYKY